MINVTCCYCNNLYINAVADKGMLRYCYIYDMNCAYPQRLSLPQPDQ